MESFRVHIRSNLIGYLALFVALGGSAYAVGKNTIGTKQLKPDAVKSSKVANGSLLSDDFATGQLPAGVQGPKGDQGPPGAPGAPGQDASSPAGAVSFFNLAACPSGWTELTSGRGRYLVGRPSNGTLAGTVGTALTNLENRPVGQHNHGITDPGHDHNTVLPIGGDENIFSGYDLAGQNSTRSHASDDSQTGITVNNAGAVAGTNAPYIQLLVCQKD
jgi:hypothetical protein